MGGGHARRDRGHQHRRWQRVATARRVAPCRLDGLNGVARLSLQSAEGLKLSVSGQSQSYVLTVLVAIVLFLTSVSWFLT